jgi:hypothetical protein
MANSITNGAGLQSTSHGQSQGVLHRREVTAPVSSIAAASDKIPANREGEQSFLPLTSL